MSLKRSKSAPSSDLGDPIPLGRTTSAMSSATEDYTYEEDMEEAEEEDYTDVDYTDADGEDSDAYSEIKSKKVAVETNKVSQNLMRVNDGQYKIVDYSEIETIMASLINDVMNLLNVSDDVCRILLCHFKWNKERLIDGYYADADRLLENVGLPTDQSSSTNDSAGNSCPICGDDFDSSELFNLDCLHKFCRSCYGTYLEGKIEEGPSCVRTKCPMFKCNHTIPYSFFSKLTDGSMNKKYRLYLTRNFIETSKNIRWCPFPGCEKVAIGAGITHVMCNCNRPFCFKCGEEAHDPVCCDYLSEWNQKCSNESETANWILANTKKCPQCNARIEKNQGCNHMSCKLCRFEFCWICMGSWTDHGQTTGGYYKCNRFEAVVSDGSDAQKAKVELDRYLHYYQRFHAHDRSLVYASSSREEAEKRMVEIQEAGKTAWIDVQFLRQAVEQVIDCRRVLKYTYVLGYFLEDNTQEKRLFEHHQEMLEKHTETLHHYTEMPLESIDRTQVVNLTRVAEKFMSSLLSSLMNSSDYGYKPKK